MTPGITVSTGFGVALFLLLRVVLFLVLAVVLFFAFGLCRLLALTTVLFLALVATLFFFRDLIFFFGIAPASTRNLWLPVNSHPPIQ